MQQPIRYYITKSGEEPTVRSVKVAQEAPTSDMRDDLATQRAAENASSPRESAPPRDGVKVKQLMQGAIRRRLHSH